MTAIVASHLVEPRATRVEASRGWRRRAAFGLALLVNIVLFLPPSEMGLPGQNVPYYKLLLLPALALSAPEIVQQLRLRSLVASPITACVLALLPIIMLSQLAHRYIGGAVHAGADYGRLLAYYLLMIAVVDTPRRFIVLMRVIGWLALIVAALALMGYHGLVHLEIFAPMQQRVTDLWRGAYVIPRLCGPGVFNDPNDLCLLLVPGMALWLYRLHEDGWRRKRLIGLVALVALPVFGYALLLTRSRGGFIVLVTAVCAYLISRLGWRRMLPWACVLLPLLFIAFAGRQTNVDISDREDTAQSRIQLWAEGLTFFRRAPVFGIGYGNFSDEAGNAAHNSFLHCFSELGFFGGMFFLGAFYLAIAGLHQLAGDERATPDLKLRRLRPYVMAAIAGYTAGMLSLSRSRVAPTFLMLALAVTYMRLAAPAQIYPSLSLRLMRRLVIISLLFLAALYAFVRVTVRWS